MKVILPVMTASGKSYASTEDFLAKVHGETSGNWLLNVSAHWHGGIHLSDANCAPNAKLTDDLVDANKVTGLQSMTDGHIVAYRLNDTYCTAPYSGSRGAKNLRFSSSFILIKSTCQPDVAQPNDSLDFYTLWLHLAPLSEYHGRRYCIIKANNLSLREDNVSSGWISSGMPSSLPATAENKASYEAPHKIPSARLAKGAVLEIVDGANNFFLIDERNGNSKIHPFYRVKLASSEAAVGTSLEGREFWVSASQEHVTLAGAVMPEWMLFAQRRGVFNSVVNLSEAEMLPIQAGGLVGHLGLREDPIPHSNNIASGYNTHLEVFTDDSRLPAFMDNTAGLTTGVHFVKVLQDKSLFYFRPTEETFVPMEIAGDRMQTYEELIIEENRLEKKTQDGKSWYRVTSGGWLPESDVELVNQFDLTGRGFTRLEQDTPPTDIRAGTRESWFRKGMEFLHAATEKSRNFSYATHPRAYARVLSEMDENGDGQISPDELKRYFHHNRPDLVPIVDSFVVKHQSEWYHDGSASAWGAAMASMEKFEWGLAEYTKAFIDQLIWVKEVPTLSDGAAWWHMHPVVFLDAIKSQNEILKGKLTYNAEGDDIPSSIYYSRVIHWPGNDLSGVTLGRGYDMGDRTETAVYSDMVASGIASEQATKISKGAGLKGSAARNFVRSNKRDVGSITLQQQESLFAIIYPKYIDRAILNYNKWTNGVLDAKPWVELDSTIQEVLVDFVYQGFTKGPKPMLAGSNNNKQELIGYIRTTPSISQYEPGRQRANYLESSE